MASWVWIAPRHWVNVCRFHARTAPPVSWRRRRLVATDVNATRDSPAHTVRQTLTIVPVLTATTASVKINKRNFTVGVTQAGQANTVTRQMHVCLVHVITRCGAWLKAAATGVS